MSSGETRRASSLNLHRSERQWGQKRRKRRGNIRGCRQDKGIVVIKEQKALRESKRQMQTK